MTQHSSSFDYDLTDLILRIFRLHAHLVQAGDQLVAPLGLSSARWLVMGALEQATLTAPQIAHSMGTTRQGTQKQLNHLLALGWVTTQANPKHERSPRYALTTEGQAIYSQVMQYQRKWLAVLGAPIDAQSLKETLALLALFEQQLVETPTQQAALTSLTDN